MLGTQVQSTRLPLIFLRARSCYTSLKIAAWAGKVAANLLFHTLFACIAVNLIYRVGKLRIKLNKI